MFRFPTKNGSFEEQATVKFSFLATLKKLVENDG